MEKMNHKNEMGNKCPKCGSALRIASFRTNTLSQPTKTVLACNVCNYMQDSPKVPNNDVNK